MLVWDQRVAGSNPATPTMLRTPMRTDTPENARLFLSRSRVRPNPSLARRSEMRSGIFVYVAERVKRDMWAVVHFAPAGRKTVHVTGSDLEAARCAQECQRAFEAGFEAGLVAQKYSPEVVKRIMLEEAA